MKTGYLVARNRLVPVVNRRYREAARGSMACEARRPVERIVLLLPRPPSVNALTINTPDGRAPDERYKAWIKAAGWDLLRQRPGMICGTYELVLRIRKPERHQPDLGNLEKAVSDLLQKHRVIVNDRLSQRIVLEWVGAASHIEKDWVEVELTPMAEVT